MTDIRNKKIDDELLDDVSGGAQKVVQNSVTENGSLGKRKSPCPRCGVETTFEIFSGGRAVCVDCGYEKFM